MNSNSNDAKRSSGQQANMTPYITPRCCCFQLTISECRYQNVLSEGTLNFGPLRDQQVQVITADPSRYGISSLTTLRKLITPLSPLQLIPLALVWHRSTRRLPRQRTDGQRLAQMKTRRKSSRKRGAEAWRKCAEASPGPHPS